MNSISFDKVVRLPYNPTEDLQATTKQYVDALGNTKVNLAGDSLSGFLVLHSDPMLNMHAATKQYVDNAYEAAAYNITFDPTGTGLSATNVQDAIEELNTEKLSTVGGVMTGSLILPSSEPIASYEATHKSYVDRMGTYEFTQATTSDSWSIPYTTHNLNRRPSVTVIDASGNEVFGKVIYNTGNFGVTIQFNTAISGVAILS